jgi:hypothetical protein
MSVATDCHNDETQPFADSAFTDVFADQRRIGLNANLGQPLLERVQLSELGVQVVHQAELLAQVAPRQ